MARFIFITGGVVSSLGKGLSSASLGALLQSHGYKVKLRKLDPYLNVDPGTMNPFQHGEVFVTDDGAETDLDIGHYERFTGISATRSDNITTGGIYSDIIKRSLSAHNTYLDILFRNGIVGLLLVLLVFAQIIKYFYNNSHSNYSLSAISFFFSTLFMAAGYEIIFFTILSVNLFFWCGFAFLVNQIEISKKN